LALVQTQPNLRTSLDASACGEVLTAHDQRFELTIGLDHGRAKASFTRQRALAAVRPRVPSVAWRSDRRNLARVKVPRRAPDGRL